MKPTILFTRISGNEKVGPIPTSGSTSDTCPDACPLKKGEGNYKYGGCYAKGFPSIMHWRRLDEGRGGITWDEYCREISKLRPGTLHRVNQFGDLPGDGAANLINDKKLAQLVTANRGKPTLCYTHFPVLDSQASSNVVTMNRAAIKSAVDKGMTINLSGNSLSHADELLKLGIAPVVAIVPTEQTKNCLTPAGNRVVICPASVRDDVTCASCGLCARAKREYVIAFPAQGVRKKHLSALAAA